MSEGGQKVQTSSYKVNKYWGCNVQHADYSKQCSMGYLNVAKGVDPKCSPHKKKNCNYMR